MANLTLSGDALFSTSETAGFGNSLSAGYATGTPPSDLGNSWTVEASLTGTDITATQAAVGVNAEWWIGLKGGFPYVSYQSTTVVENITSSVATLDGETFHLAFTAGQSGAVLWLNGVNVGSSSLPVQDDIPTDSVMIIRERFNSSDSVNWSGTVNEVALFSYEKYTQDFTVPSSPYTGEESNLSALYHLDSDSDDYTVDSSSTVDPVEEESNELTEWQFPPNNESITYSPYNWRVDGETAKTVNAGAYFRFKAKATSCTLNFDVSNLTGTMPKIAIKVDDRTFQSEYLSSSVVVVFPSDVTYGTHIIEVIFDAVSGAALRWNTDEGSLLLKSIELSENGILSPVQSRSKSIIIIGDSITEGVDTINGYSGDRIVDNSATCSWALEAAKAVDAEVGIVAFAGQGFSKVGGGDVPRAAYTYKYLWNDEDRDFSDAPDAFVFLMGHNDGTSNTTSAVTNMINEILAINDTSKLIFFRPLSGNQSEKLISAVSGCNDQSRVKYESTEGFFTSSESSDSIHPWGYAAMDKIQRGITAKMATDMSLNYLGSQSTVSLSIGGIPDGSYLVTLYNDSGRVVYSGDVSFLNEEAVVSEVETLPGDSIGGSVKSSDSTKGAVISAVAT